MIKMIETFFRNLARLDENDRKVDEINRRIGMRTAHTTVLLEKAGKLQEILVQKTTTYYIGKAIGVIR